MPQSLALLISAAAEVGGARRHLAESPAVALGWLRREAFPTVQKVPSGGGRGLSLSQAFGCFISQQDQIFSVVSEVHFYFTLQSTAALTFESL